MKTPEPRQRRRSGVFIVNCEHISVFTLIIDSEQESLCWIFLKKTKTFEDKIGLKRQRLLKTRSGISCVMLPYFKCEQIFLTSNFYHHNHTGKAVRNRIRDN